MYNEAVAAETIPESFTSKVIIHPIKLAINPLKRIG